MTQVDSARALGRPLDPTPSGYGQVTAVTPLPAGWGYFCSRPDEINPARWYAVPPWNVYRTKARFKQAAARLEATVDADTWPRLHAAVAAQERLYDFLTGRGEE